MKHWFFYRKLEMTRAIDALEARVTLARLILDSGAPGFEMAALLDAAGLGDLVEIGPPRRHAAGVSASGQRARIRGLLRAWREVQPKIRQLYELAEEAERVREEAAGPFPRDDFEGACQRAAEAAAPIEERMYALLQEIKDDLAIGGGALGIAEDGTRLKLVDGVAIREE